MPLMNSPERPVKRPVEVAALPRRLLATFTMALRPDRRIEKTRSLISSPPDLNSSMLLRLRLSTLTTSLFPP